MSHVMFDTLKFVENLKEGGMSEKQAKAVTEAQNQALIEALDNTLATKGDIAILKGDINNLRYELKSDIGRLEARLKLVEWMLGFLLAGMTALIIKSFF